jgi:hypothetical protein
MNKKCFQCHLVNFSDANACARCNADLTEVVDGESPRKGIVRWLAIRTIVIAGACLIITIGFYLSLIGSAKTLTMEQNESVLRAIDILREKDFDTEVMLLSRFTAFRGSDHWLNAAVAKENAYAATNFPFLIMTLYSDFFTYPIDDVERAAILLHEARHLAGDGEKEAYEFVWRNRNAIRWTREKYQHSPVWHNVRQQTRENVPLLFVCTSNEFGDCTESLAPTWP